MFGLSTLWTLGIGAAVLALLTGGAYIKGHRDGTESEHAKAIVRENELNEKINAANVEANKAGMRYEEWKSRQQPKIVYVKQKVKDALQTNPDWSVQPIPDGVRDAIAAAAAALVPAEPASGVPAAPGKQP